VFIIIIIIIIYLFIYLFIYLVIDSIRRLLGTPSYKILVGKSERKRPFWRPKLRWEDNISCL